MRAPPNFNIPDSSGIVGRSTGCIQGVVLQYFTCTVSLPFCAATVAFRRHDCCRHRWHTVLLHHLVITLVVCTGPWVGARCLPAGSFRVKGCAITPSCALSLSPKQPSRLRDTSSTWRHTRARASSPCSWQSRVGVVMSQANGLNILLSPRCV